ncbi:hypothetical protein FVE85_2272 [Porphyridium purpureum]|uniref:Uncharacterized protein n=1 Tax=Porphyridium purpureum TaxID=35688 RepID=A0A5J4Z092_PORPP|nr:hypothetical protein FVE85_2272 [Porphyridium purpureum]|eukprot:POR8588..scf209_3
MMSAAAVPDMDMMSDAGALPALTEVFVIYDADGTVAGELAYLVKKWFGKGHCAACDITHGPRREKPEWQDFKMGLGVPMKNIHRDEMDVDLYNATRGHLFPNVVGRFSDDSHMVLMDPNELDKCAGQVEIFEAMLKEKLALIGASSAGAPACGWSAQHVDQGSLVGRPEQMVPEM